ncbi:flagellar type III secretion system pore protein FliP [Pirellula sp. SH-Sr6A]|uniref:flagellar type III secretion system pore protein FliP n=1 Tax=Pirellula sp. SH-Sr6A TaxID=1632865 RepID=UPI0011BA8E75|nr:flagellar type III secretion system pore protein FliP [Pirellula sp. SH-Sr6A]
MLANLNTPTVSRIRSRGIRLLESAYALVLVVVASLVLSTASSAMAQTSTDDFLSRAQQIRDSAPVRKATAENERATDPGSGLEQLVDRVGGGPAEWISPRGLSSSLQILLLLTVLSLAPAILLMTTCYVRIIVVFGLLKQALGAQQLPPSQVITSISLFVTLFVMSPVWNRVYEDAIEPYTTEGSRMTATEAWDKGVGPIREFMIRQIDLADNHDDVHLFYSRYAPGSQGPSSFDDVPLQVLLPAYMLSELKTAFLMGFKIYLPFLILDIVIASVTVSMGMMMLPPALISTPFKLLLFVLVDGWRLVVSMLLDSFGTLST